MLKSNLWWVVTFQRTRTLANGLTRFTTAVTVRSMALGHD